MASGLILTLLCVTGESSLWALALGTSLSVIALLSILRTRPGGKVLAAGITAAGVIVWLIAGGVADAVEVVRALLLHFSGLTAALPLVARPFAALLGVTCGFIGYGLTSRRVGAYPALATVLLMALLLERPAADNYLPMIIGGDTLMGFMQQLPEAEISPLGEAAPGAVLFMAPMAGHVSRIIVSKSGGFGTEDLLSRIRQNLQKGTEDEAISTCHAAAGI